MPNWFINIRSKGAKKASNEVKGLTGNLNGMASAAKKAAIVFGVGFLGKQIFDVGKAAINTAAQFETLRTRLTFMYGSVQRGTKAFEAFNKVAATTPFQLANVVEAGATLKAFGVDPENMIKPVADLAAFMGVDVVEAASAMGRGFAAGAGAADLLRDRGILALVEEFKGIEKITDLTLPEFRDAMTEALLDPSLGIAGATTQLADTWSGAVSNFQDGADRLKAALGDELIKALRPKLDEINKLLSTFGEIGWGNIGSTFASNMELFTDYAQRLAGLGGEIIGRSLMQGLFTAMAESGPILQRAVADMFSFLPGIAGLMNLTADATELLGQSFVKNADQSAEIIDAWEDIQMTASMMIGNWVILAENQKEATQGSTEAINEEAKALKKKGDITKAVSKITVESGIQAGLSAQSSLGAVRSVIKAKLSEMLAGLLAKQITKFGFLGVLTGAAIAGAANAMFERNVPKFAQGANFVTSGPQMMMVGDNPGGQERVSVTPLSSPNIEGPQGSSVTVNVSGNVLSQDFVEGELAENIKEAIRRGTDFGIS